MVPIVLLSLSGVHSEASEHLTGKEWPGISEQRKLYFVFGKRESAEYQGVTFTHSVKDDIDYIDNKILKDPGLGGETLNNIYYSAVYEREAASREILYRNRQQIESPSLQPARK